MDAELVKACSESALCSHNTSVAYNSLLQQAMNIRPGPAIFTCPLNNVVLNYLNKSLVEWYGLLTG